MRNREVRNEGEIKRYMRSEGLLLHWMIEYHIWKGLFYSLELSSIKWRLINDFYRLNHIHEDTILVECGHSPHELNSSFTTNNKLFIIIISSFYFFYKYFNMLYIYYTNNFYIS